MSPRRNGWRSGAALLLTLGCSPTTTPLPGHEADSRRLDTTDTAAELAAPLSVCLPGDSDGTELLTLSLVLFESTARQRNIVSMAPVFQERIALAQPRRATTVAADLGDHCEWLHQAPNWSGPYLPGGDVSVSIGRHPLSAVWAPWMYSYAGGYQTPTEVLDQDALSTLMNQPIVIDVEGAGDLPAFQLTGLHTPPTLFDLPPSAPVTTRSGLAYRWTPGASRSGRVRFEVRMDGWSELLVCETEDDGTWVPPAELWSPADPTQDLVVRARVYSQRPCRVDIDAIDGRTATIDIEHSAGWTTTVTPHEHRSNQGP